MQQVLNSLINNPVSEPIFIGALIDNHGVFHIISGIGEHSNNSISAGVVVTELEILIEFGPDEWFLAVQNTVHLVIKPVIPVQDTGPHGLLRHLALIHVTWGLVVV